MTHLPIILIAALSLAWNTPQTEPGGAGTIRLDVVAVDERGAPVTDLKPAEFEVWISGYRAPIKDVVAVTPGTHRPTIVLLLDNVAVGPNIMPRLKATARHFVEGMGPGEELAIVLLDGGRLAFTGDRRQLLDAIEALHPRGLPLRPEDAGEDVLGTMEMLAGQLQERGAGRRIVVGIGAGWVFDKPLPPPGVRDLDRRWAAAMRAMAAANVSLYVIDPVGLGAVRNTGVDGGDSGFARETGGHAFLETNDLDGAADRVRMEAGSYYILETANPPVQRNADLRKVEVKVLRKGVTVRARRGIKGRD
jgi:VWFA-related protein